MQKRRRAAHRVAERPGNARIRPHRIAGRPGNARIRPRAAVRTWTVRAAARLWPYQDQLMTSRMSRAVSLGVLPTLTPAASRASFLASAVPAEPEMIAPAWPMVLPTGAVKPAM